MSNFASRPNSSTQIVFTLLFAALGFFSYLLIPHFVQKQGGIPILLLAFVGANIGFWGMIIRISGHLKAAFGNVPIAKFYRAIIIGLFVVIYIFGSAFLVARSFMEHHPSTSSETVTERPTCNNHMDQVKEGTVRLLKDEAIQEINSPMIDFDFPGGDLNCHATVLTSKRKFKIDYTWSLSRNEYNVSVFEKTE